jgi:maltose alpha-D-glucosyltransferase/alpha-amylase
VPALAGQLDYTDAQGRRCTLALLEQYVPNQGNLRCRTEELLRRLCDEYFGARADDAWCDDPAQISFEALVARLGSGVAELHLALAAVSGDAFRPEPIGDADATPLRDGLYELSTRTLARLARRLETLPDVERRRADSLLAKRDRIEQLLTGWSSGPPGPLRCRVHGDLCLERVLVAEDQLVFTGAGGPVGAPAALRRRKQPPQSDLGRLLCSVHETVAAVEQKEAIEHPDPPGRLAETFGVWRRHVVRQLLAAYAAAVAGSRLSPEAEDGASEARIWSFGLVSALEGLDDALMGRSRRVGDALSTVLTLLSDAGDGDPEKSTGETRGPAGSMT